MNFEKWFYSISAAEQKVLLRKLIDHRVIDRENLVAGVYLWKLPKGEVVQIDQLI